MNPSPTGCIAAGSDAVEVEGMAIPLARRARYSNRDILFLGVDGVPIGDGKGAVEITDAPTTDCRVCGVDGCDGVTTVVGV